MSSRQVPIESLPLIQRVKGIALSQLADAEGSKIALEESLQAARASHNIYEEAVTLLALSETEPNDTTREGLHKEATSLLKRLGVRQVNLSGRLISV